ncbi:MAG: hypothetical protein ACK41E_09645 [Deinococcales bacterium]
MTQTASCTANLIATETRYDSGVYNKHSIVLEREHRVLAYSATPTVMRYLPPFVMSKAEIDQVVAATAEVLASISPK